jgi:hypothetical protein
MSEMTRASEKEKIIRIIACRVFKPALEYLELESRYPGIRLTYLPPVLHLKPQELGKYLRREIIAAERNNERIICLYGDCFPGISDYCRRHEAIRVPGSYCWEMFLGSARFQGLLEENAGTYFIEKELLLNFKDYCIEPLELYDKEIRDMFFQHYHRLLYVRQPTDPDLVPEATELAHFLDLALEVEDADYTHLEKELIKLL